MITIDIVYNSNTDATKTIVCDYIREYKDHFLAVKRVEEGYIRYWINKSNIVFLCMLEKEVRKNE